MDVDERSTYISSLPPWSPGHCHKNASYPDSLPLHEVVFFDLAESLFEAITDFDHLLDQFPVSHHGVRHVRRGSLLDGILDLLVLIQGPLACLTHLIDADPEGLLKVAGRTYSMPGI